MIVFEPWSKKTDVTFSDLDIHDAASKSYHLCPYSSLNIHNALSIGSMNKRIALIDTLILKGLGV